VAGTQRWTAERSIPQDRGSGPLPSFEMPSAEVIDPDKTLKRPQSVDLRAVPSLPSPNRTEEICAEDVLEVAEKLDAISTQEILADDVLDVIPLRQRIYPNPRITMIPENDPAHGMPPIPPPPFWNQANTAPRRPLPTPPPRQEYQPVSAAPADAPASPSRISTIAPVALDIDLPVQSFRSRLESTFSLETLRGSRRRLDVSIAIAMGAFVGIFVLGFALRSVSASPVVRANATQSSHAANGANNAGRAPIGMSRPPVSVAAPAFAAPAIATPVTTGATTSGTPTFDVSSLPQAPVGTVTLAPVVSGHRLFIDGAVASHSAAVVSCGKHVVRIGSRGRDKWIDVPCGGEVVVAP
jgi:hypothetical protein